MLKIIYLKLLLHIIKPVTKNTSKFIIQYFLNHLLNIIEVKILSKKYPQIADSTANANKVNGTCSPPE